MGISWVWADWAPAACLDIRGIPDFLHFRGRFNRFLNLQGFRILKFWIPLYQ